MTTLTATFDTRREAEMTVERLVQEHDIDRKRISVVADGPENSAGTDEAGSDAPDDKGDDAPLNGAVIVMVDLDDDATVNTVRAAFEKFNSAGVVEN